MICESYIDPRIERLLSNWEVPSKLDLAVEAALSEEQRQRIDREAHERFVDIMTRDLIARLCSGVLQ